MYNNILRSIDNTMGSKKKEGFKNVKLLSSRIELSDYNKFNAILKYRDGKKLQEILNMFIVEYISGNLYLTGSSFGVKEEMNNV